MTLYMTDFDEKLSKFSKSSYMMGNDDFARKTLKTDFIAKISDEYVL